MNVRGWSNFVFNKTHELSTKSRMNGSEIIPTNSFFSGSNDDDVKDVFSIPCSIVKT